LINAAIRVIHEDRQGALWVGTRSGLNHYRKGKFSTYTTAKGLAGNDVMVVYEDANGTVWIGTDGGLSRWDKGKFTNLPLATGSLITRWMRFTKTANKLFGLARRAAG
jgi:ligand-binding sensor domain-containing protein